MILGSGHYWYTSSEKRTLPRLAITSRLALIFVALLCYIRVCKGLNPSLEDNTQTHNGIYIHTYSRKEVSTYLPTSILKSGVVSDMIFAVQQKNIHELTNILYDISDPDSPNYGQHWSKDEVPEFTSNPEGLDVDVSYLNSNGASVVSETRTSEYITARAPIKV